MMVLGVVNDNDDVVGRRVVASGSFDVSDDETPAIATADGFQLYPQPPTTTICHQSSPIGLKSVTRARNPSYNHYSHRHVRYVTHPLSAYTARPMPINRWLSLQLPVRAPSEAPSFGPARYRVELLRGGFWMAPMTQSSRSRQVLKT